MVIAIIAILPPLLSHNGAASLSFADGHTEQKKCSTRARHPHA